jgi:hypothetical protein
MADELGKVGNFGVGERWIQKYIVNNVSEFKGTTVTFEETLKAGENIRRIDVIVDASKTKRIFYEFKSTTTIPPEYFAEQFIKDLQLDGVQSLDQIKWIFDASKVSSLDKTKFIDELRKVNIDDKIIRQWVPNTIKDPTKVDLLDVIYDGFDKIFKIKKI